MGDTKYTAIGYYLRFEEPLEIHNKLFGDWRMVTHLTADDFMLYGDDEAIFTWGSQTFTMPISNILHAHTGLRKERVYVAPQYNYQAAAWETYRTTEPGDPRRRGIGAYL